MNYIIAHYRPVKDESLRQPWPMCRCQAQAHLVIAAFAAHLDAELIITGRIVWQLHLVYQTITMNRVNCAWSVRIQDTIWQAGCDGWVR